MSKDSHFRTSTTCVLLCALWSLGAQAAVQDIESKVSTGWFPLVVSARLGVAHGTQDSHISLGGTLAYQGGAPQDGKGWFWTAGASGAWIKGVVHNSPEKHDGFGFSVGPEGRIGFAWGNWRRASFVHLRLHPYLLSMRSESEGEFVGLGARLALGAGFDPGSHTFMRSPLWGFPNLLELVADCSSGLRGPAARVGVEVGWEF